MKLGLYKLEWNLFQVNKGIKKEYSRMKRGILLFAACYLL